tara:strand:+ start:288 stop:467 length:180 start_codon:yes stop_codon:yes gene_type:complete
MSRQEYGHTDQHVAPGLGATPPSILVVPRVYYLEGVEDGVLAQHRMAQRGEKAIRIWRR